MLGYNFKLEKVLNYKENIENVKKGEYGEVNSKLEKAQYKLTKYNIYRENLISEKNNMIENTNIGSLKLYSDYLKSISNDIKKQEKLILDINIELKSAKEELMKAMQEKKTLEKLKEKNYNEFIQEVNKDEEKITDAINSFKNNTQR